jgi:hypothetical protein
LLRSQILVRDLGSDLGTLHRHFSLMVVKRVMRVLRAPSVVQLVESGNFGKIYLAFILLLLGLFELRAGGEMLVDFARLSIFVEKIDDLIAVHRALTVSWDELFNFIRKRTVGVGFWLRAEGLDILCDVSHSSAPDQIS